MLLNLFFHDISEHTISTTLVLLRYLSILDVSLTIVKNIMFLLLCMSFMDAPLTIINIEELIDRVLVWRAGTQNSQAQEYLLRQLRWDDYFAT